MNFFALSVSDPFRDFQRKVLHAVLSAGAVCAFLFVLADWVGLNTLGSTQLLATLCAIFCFLGLLLLSLRSSRAYVPVAAVALVSSYALFASALFNVTTDELRATWFLLGIGVSYLLLGRASGLAYSLASLALILGTNHHLDHPFSGHALTTLTLAIVWCSALFYLYSEHAYALYHQLGENEIRYRKVFDHALDGICVAQEGQLRFVNPQISHYLGYSTAEIIGKPFVDFIHPADREKVYQQHLSRLSGGEPPARYEARILAKNGDTRWYAIGSTLIEWDGHPATLNTLSEISERKRVEDFENFRTHILEMMAAGVPIATTLQEIVAGIEALDRRMVCAIMLLDATGQVFLPPISPTLPQAYNNAMTGAAIGYGVGSCGTAAFLGKRIVVGNIDTHPYWAPYLHLAEMAQVKACWSQPIRAANNAILGTFAIYHQVPNTPSDADINLIEKTADLVSIAIERQRTDELIHDMANYDSLTGLPNRRLLDDRLGVALANSKRSGQLGALMMLDLDNFKPLNDEYGHALGDLLLGEVGDRLEGSIREVDTVARLGGDEFVVVLNGLSDDVTASAEFARAVAEKIRVSLALPYLLESAEPEDGNTIVEHHCTASIGIVLFNGQETSQTELIKRADRAMYHAKDAGRNQVWMAELAS